MQLNLQGHVAREVRSKQIFLQVTRDLLDLPPWASELLLSLSLSITFPATPVVVVPIVTSLTLS